MRVLSETQAALLALLVIFLLSGCGGYGSSLSPQQTQNSIPGG